MWWKIFETVVVIAFLALFFFTLYIMGWGYGLGL